MGGGFSAACGHGTIALGAWAVETGRVTAPPSGSVDIVIDVPSGRVTARVHREDAGGGCHPQVTGMAYRTGEHVFSIDPHDPLVPGFVLR